MSNSFSLKVDKFQFRRGASVPSTLLDGEPFYKQDDNLLYIGGNSQPINLRGDDGRELLIRVDSGFIQTKYEDELSWSDLIALSALQGPSGSQGIQGPQGIQGNSGANGRDVELQATATHLQWRLIGDITWINLIALNQLYDYSVFKSESTSNIKPNGQVAQENDVLLYNSKVYRRIGSEWRGETRIANGYISGIINATSNLAGFYLAPSSIILELRILCNRTGTWNGSNWFDVFILKRESNGNSTNLLSNNLSNTTGWIDLANPVSIQSSGFHELRLIRTGSTATISGFHWSLTYQERF